MANPTTGGLIWRLLVLIGVQAVAVLAVAFAFFVAGKRFDVIHHAIGFGVLTSTMLIAQVIAERPVDEVNALSRLGLLSASRAGLPFVAVVLLNYLAMPGLLDSTVIYLLTGYVAGTTASLILTVKMLARRDHEQRRVE